MHIADLMLLVVDGAHLLKQPSSKGIIDQVEIKVQEEYLDVFSDDSASALYPLLTKSLIHIAIENFQSQTKTLSTKMKQFAGENYTNC